MCNCNKTDNEELMIFLDERIMSQLDLIEQKLNVMEANLNKIEMDVLILKQRFNSNFPLDDGYLGGK